MAKAEKANVTPKIDRRVQANKFIKRKLEKGSSSKDRNLEHLITEAPYILKREIDIAKQVSESLTVNLTTKFNPSFETSKRISVYNQNVHKLTRDIDVINFLIENYPNRSFAFPEDYWQEEYFPLRETSYQSFGSLIKEDFDEIFLKKKALEQGVESLDSDEAVYLLEQGGLAPNGSRVESEIRSALDLPRDSEFINSYILNREEFSHFYLEEYEKVPTKLKDGIKLFNRWEYFGFKNFDHDEIFKALKRADLGFLKSDDRSNLFFFLKFAEITEEQKNLIISFVKNLTKEEARSIKIKRTLIFSDLINLREQEEKPPELIKAENNYREMRKFRGNYDLSQNLVSANYDSEFSTDSEEENNDSTTEENESVEEDFEIDFDPLIFALGIVDDG
jgi:hypothetical protein